MFGVNPSQIPRSSSRWPRTVPSVSASSFISPIMQPALFSLVMISAHVSVMVDCRPQHHQQLQAEPAATSGRFHSELTKAVRKGVHRGLLVILPGRTARSNLVSMFDLRRKRFLCMDFKGELYKSRQKDRLDCLFQHIWSDEAKQHDVLRSLSGDWLLRAGGRDLIVVHREPSDVSSAMLEKLLQPSVRRRRRSQEVNPSDPLRSESNPSHPAKDRVQPGPEQTGSVSKETITSVDDPLWVLRPDGHGSPVKTNIAERAEHE